MKNALPISREAFFASSALIATSLTLPLPQAAHAIPVDNLRSIPTHFATSAPRG